MNLDPTFVYANYAEACLWAGLGVFTLFRSRGVTHVALAVALLLFAVSDVIEARTGAWYEPWWLLAWKALCVATIAGCGLTIWRRRQRRSAG